MLRKLKSAVCLLALVTGHALALATPLASTGLPACCGATVCPMRVQAQHAPPRPGRRGDRDEASPEKASCHSGSSAAPDPLSECAVKSCNPREQHALPAQPYLVPEPFEISSEAPLALTPGMVTPFFPAHVADVDSPPPRAATP